jgi:N-acetylglucosaminyldiphosphoundecaprenol N-acetyl-beta-D-mannosaminyltransferase
MPDTPQPTPGGRALTIGSIHVDRVSLAEAIELIVGRAQRGEGGYVLTPNVDHVCLAERDAELQEIYRHAFLSLTDGVPLTWFSRALGRPVEQVAGSDLVAPLIVRAAQLRLRVYFLAGSRQVGALAAGSLRRMAPELNVVGIDDPHYVPAAAPEEIDKALRKIAAARPHLVLVGMGCPKQEYFMSRHASRIAPAVAIGVGASLDFLAGAAPRAPRWLSRVGLEWAYRLAQEPRRLARRYLVRDRAIVGILARTWWEHRIGAAAEPVAGHVPVATLHRADASRGRTSSRGCAHGDVAEGPP